LPVKKKALKYFSAFLFYLIIYYNISANIYDRI